MATGWADNRAVILWDARLWLLMCISEQLAADHDSSSLYRFVSAHEIEQHSFSSGL